MSSINCANLKLTSRQFDHRIARAATALASIELSREDGISVMMRNEPTFIETSMAPGNLRAYSVPINWHALPGDAKFILGRLGRQSSGRPCRSLSQYPKRRARKRQDLFCGNSVAVCGAYRIDAGATTVPKGALVWSACRDSCEPRGSPPETLPQILFYYVRYHGTLQRGQAVHECGDIHTILIVMALSYGFLGEHCAPAEISTDVTGPTYYGLPAGHANFCVRAEADVTMMPRFDPELLLKIIEEKRVTHLNMVPIMFQRLLWLLGMDSHHMAEIQSRRSVVFGCSSFTAYN